MQVAHLWKSQGHLAPFLATSVQAAEALIDVETGFPAALAEPGYHKSQSGSRSFQLISFYELGEWCICTRRTHQPLDFGTPSRDGRFRGMGLPPSGSDQPSTCTDRIRCKNGVLSPEIWSHECRKWLVGCPRRPSMSARRPAVRRPSVESVESMAMVHRYSTNTLRTTG